MSWTENKLTLTRCKNFDWFYKLFVECTREYKNINICNKTTKSYCHLGKLLNVIPNSEKFKSIRNFVIYDVENYVNIYRFINDILYPLFDNFFKGYGKLKHIVHFSVRTRFHEFSPKIPYLSLSHKIHDENDRMIFKLKFSPYISLETNKPELTLGIKILDPQYMMFLSLLKTHMCLLEGYECTNLTDNNIFLYAILNKIISNGLDPTRKYFEQDVSELHQYAEKLNKLIPVQLKFSQNGLIEYRNKNIKLLPLRDIIAFPNITSYIFHHSA